MDVLKWEPYRIGVEDIVANLRFRERHSANLSMPLSHEDLHEILRHLARHRYNKRRAGRGRRSLGKRRR